MNSNLKLIGQKTFIKKYNVPLCKKAKNNQEKTVMH